ncbi:MAG: uracil-DNA glycosylase [Opitutaceae bacterium]|nr:uracil-DNA glycosylase [Verrucomicrobiales bacterium]
MKALPASWSALLGNEVNQPYFHELVRFVNHQRDQHSIFPADADLFSAFELTSPERVKVVLLGQDPYPGANQAHGLAFSVQRDVPIPRSLRNIYRELRDDLGTPPPDHGNLEAWARQGVLLLNTVLTVRAGEPNSHAGQGWETFTDAVIRAVARQTHRVVFILWGNYAQKKSPLIPTPPHVVVSSVHPSPLSARRGFFGSKPFSRTNQALREAGREPVDWALL